MTDINKLRQRCFFDITIGDKNVGRIVFELFNDTCPKTCDNFRSLCTGEKGSGKTTGKPLHYKNVIFHRVVKGFIIQSGDFSMGNGRGGESIYGGTFNDENFVLKHDKPFLLSMANRGKDTNGSQFFITLNPAPHLDGVHVVFGHVLSGQEFVNEIQNQPTKEDGRPLADVTISNCGELIPQIKTKDKKKKHKKEKRKSDGEISTDEEDREGSKKKKKDKKQKKHKKSKDNKKDENEDRNEEVDKELEELNANCSVKPEEIPDIPENNFLLRDITEKEDWTSDRYKKGHRNDWRSRRKVKGRGFTRYRTPSPSRHYRSGSETPPHWKSAQSRLVSLKEFMSSKQRDSRDDRHYSRDRNEKSRWQRSVFSRNNSRDFDIRDKFQRESAFTDTKDKSNGQTFTQKRVFTEEPPLKSKRSKRDTSPLRREELNDNDINSYHSDSENMKDSNETIRHSVKSEVKLNIRNRRDNSQEKKHSEEHRDDSPLDLKSIPLPDSDPEKKISDERRDKIQRERTYDSHSRRERTARHRRSTSRGKTSSHRRRHSEDSN